MQWTEGKHRPSHSLGRVKELTKSEAQKLRREWMKKLNDHREVAGNSRTLACFWREYFYDEEKKDAKHELKDKRPSTVRDMRCTMKNIWNARFGQRLLDSLGTAEIQKHLDSLDLNRKTAAKYRAYLSSVLSSAIRLGQGLTNNPARFVKLSVQGPEKPYVMPTAEQVVAILDRLNDPRDKMAWQLAVWLGSRCGELRALRWESVMWEHNTVLIRESVWEGKSNLPKTKKGYRKVILTADQMQVLRKRPKLAVLTGIGGCVHWWLGGHLEKRADGYNWSEGGAVAKGTTFQGSSSSMRLMGWSGRRESTSRR